MKDMAKITYETKEALNENAEILDKYKCNAADLNEIKSVVNTNDDENTTNTTNIGTLANLSTTDKSNLVSAINEMYISNSYKGKFIKVGLSSQKVFGQDTKVKIGFERVLRNNFNDDYDNYFKLNSDGTVQVMSDKIKTVVIILSYQKLSTTATNSYIDVTNKGTIAAGMTDTNTALSSISVYTDVSKDDLITGSLYSSGGSSILSTWTSASWMQVIAM